MPRLTLGPMVARRPSWARRAKSLKARSECQVSTGSRRCSLLRDSNITQDLLKGTSLDGKTFKVHFDGYDQTPMLTGTGPSNRHEVWHFAQTKLGAVRVDDWKYQFIDQPQGADQLAIAASKAHGD